MNRALYISRPHVKMVKYLVICLHIRRLQKSQILEMGAKHGHISDYVTWYNLLIKSSNYSNCSRGKSQTSTCIIMYKLCYLFIVTCVFATASVSQRIVAMVRASKNLASCFHTTFQTPSRITCRGKMLLLLNRHTTTFCTNRPPDRFKLSCFDSAFQGSKKR